MLDYQIDCPQIIMPDSWHTKFTDIKYVLECDNDNIIRFSIPYNDNVDELPHRAELIRTDIESSLESIINTYKEDVKTLISSLPDLYVVYTEFKKQEPTTEWLFADMLVQDLEDCIPDKYWFSLEDLPDGTSAVSINDDNIIVYELIISQSDDGYECLNEDVDENLTLSSFKTGL